MTPIGWMAGVGLGGWVAVTVAFGNRANPEALLGLAGPLAAAVVSWAFMVRAAGTGEPGALTRTMTRALGAKMVWFGAYVVGLLGGFDLRLLPFVASFVGFFVTLYVMEAVFLGRLSTGTGTPPQT